MQTIPELMLELSSFVFDLNTHIQYLFECSCVGYARWNAGRNGHMAIGLERDMLVLKLL
jgi:hypothetical protein